MKPEVLRVRVEAAIVEQIRWLEEQWSNSIKAESEYLQENARLTAENERLDAAFTEVAPSESRLAAENEKLRVLLWEAREFVVHYETGFYPVDLRARIDAALEEEGE
jgi:hypothetical protein